MSRRAFTVYPVSNMERARAFYEHVLGLYMGHNYRDTLVEYHQSHASLVMTSTATASDTASQMISG